MTLFQACAVGEQSSVISLTPPLLSPLERTLKIEGAAAKRQSRRVAIQACLHAASGRAIRWCSTYGTGHLTTLRGDQGHTVGLQSMCIYMCRSGPRPRRPS